MVYFSKYFMVSSEIMEDSGFVDISLDCDVPLFIDPMLIYASNNPDMKKLYKAIIDRMQHLMELSDSGENFNALERFFRFKEIHQNWLGFSEAGNRGRGLDDHFGKLLFENLAYVLETGNISETPHLEKLFILRSSIGRDTRPNKERSCFKSKNLLRQPRLFFKTIQ